MTILNEIKLVFPGNCIVKKNSAKSVGFRKDKEGKFNIIKSKNGVPINLHYYSDAYKAWAKEAVKACHSFKYMNRDVIKFPIADRLNLKCIFWFDRNTQCDMSNLYEGVQDVLAGNSGISLRGISDESYRIIEDDSVRFIGSHDGSRFLLDYTNPRTEVYLQPFKL